MSSPVFSALTTDELIRHVSMLPSVSPLELELLHRLIDAIDEIEARTIDLAAADGRYGNA